MPSEEEFCNEVAKQELSYDPWGRLRNPATQQVCAVGSEPTLFLGRGYTGHEHLTAFGLINMNARLYDPAVGRFLSPDPYVQMPDFTQNFNRYSYCLNNPLIYTDPDGEFLLLWLLFGSNTGYEMQKYLLPFAVHVKINNGNERGFVSVDASFGIPQIFPISYRRQAGVAYYWRDYDNMYSGWETNYGGEWGALGLATFSTTFYDRRGEKYDQYRDVWKLGTPIFNVQVENDANLNELNLPWLPKHISSDKHMSSEIRIRLGFVEIGNTTVTGRPYPKAIYDEGLFREGPYGTYEAYGEYDPDEYRAGILYLQIGSIRIGYNSETIRDKTQNRAHDNWFSTPRFKKLNRPGKWYWEFCF